MKIISPLPRKRGRLEIIPLIDIMFFLLAAFMVVSINKIKVDSLKINLPTDVPSVVHETKEDFVSISIDTEGQVQIDKQKISTKEEFFQRLQDLYAANHDQKILISADREAHHGDVMAALAKIRQAGFQKVAFAIKREPGAVNSGGAAPESTPAPEAAPSAPTAPPAPAAPTTSTAAPAAPSAAPETAPAAPAPPSPPAGP
jgi:biopolymer transport protein ExbD